jgi:MFS family permease
MTSEFATEASSPEQTNYREARKVALASFIGTTIEWYDYFLYGATAALVFGPLFFPAEDSAVSQLAALMTFAVGFLARPLGGIVAGHFGDRLGRKRMLVVSLVLMGGATVLVGLLPTYQQIGAWAPILLVGLRLVQGLGIGAEWGGAALMAVEHAPKNRRGLFGAAPQLGIPVGAIIANGVVLICSSFTRESFVEWGWRLGFIASIVLIVAGFVIRRSVAESPLFEQAEKTATIVRSPVLTLLRTHPLALLRSIVLGSASIAFGYLVLIFTLSYGAQTGRSRTMLLLSIIVSCVVMFVATPSFSSMSDRLGRRRTMIMGAVGQIIVGLIFFPLFDSGPDAAVFLACSLGMLALSVQYGPLPALLSEQFPTALRYTGVSIAYQSASVFGGALAPIIGTALVAGTGFSLWVGVYIACMAILSLIAALTMSETKNISLRGIQ